MNEQVTKENFEELVIKYIPLSASMSNLCNILGLKCDKFYYDKISQIIYKHNISTDHFTPQYKNTPTDENGKFIPMPDSEYFVDGQVRNGKNTLKRLIKNGYKEYKCECCGITEWNGKELSLQLHHINGNHYDNRMDNLQILCPNCHAQTETYSNKRSKRVNYVNEKEIIGNDAINERIIAIAQKTKKLCQLCGKEITTDGDKYCSPKCAQLGSRKFNVSSEQLINDFKELRTYRSVAKKYGVSDNAIKKRCIKLEIYNDIEQYITHR